MNVWWCAVEQVGGVAVAKVRVGGEITAGRVAARGVWCRWPVDAPTCFRRVGEDSGRIPERRRRRVTELYRMTQTYQQMSVRWEKGWLVVESSWALREKRGQYRWDHAVVSLTPDQVLALRAALNVLHLPAAESPQ